MIHSTQKVWYWSFWCHWWSNHQDQDVFWGKRAVVAVEPSEVAEAAEVNEAAEVFKVQKITTEDFRVILDLELINLMTKTILFWCFKKLFWQNYENPFWILALRGCWGQPMLVFWKLVAETQISKPQEYTDTFRQNLTCIFLSARAILKETVQCETPCI